MKVSHLDRMHMKTQNERRRWTFLSHMQ